MPVMGVRGGGERRARQLRGRQEPPGRAPAACAPFMSTHGAYRAVCLGCAGALGAAAAVRIAAQNCGGGGRRQGRRRAAGRFGRGKKGAAQARWGERGRGLEEGENAVCPPPWQTHETGPSGSRMLTPARAAATESKETNRAPQRGERVGGGRGAVVGRPSHSAARREGQPGGTRLTSQWPFFEGVTAELCCPRCDREGKRSDVVTCLTNAGFLLDPFWRVAGTIVVFR